MFCTEVLPDEIAASIHTLDTLTQPPNPQRPLEALVMLASLRGSTRPGVSAADAAIEKQRARDLYGHVLKTLHASQSITGSAGKAATSLRDDVDMFVEISRLWQDDDAEKLRNALEEAARASEVTGSASPALLNNLAVVKHNSGDYSGARSLYESALTSVSMGNLGYTQTQTESSSTTLLYNLARVYEDQNESLLAKEAYEKLLSRHPEYIDGK